MTPLRLVTLFGVVGSLLACCGTPAQENKALSPAKSESATAVSQGSTVPEARAAYYRRAFPNAKSFVKKDIPKELTSDPTNNNYIEAKDAQGKVLGFLRDYTGPVSPAAECACSPLSLTLVFSPDYAFQTLIAPAPLQKLGHAEMTPAEQERLIALVKNPNPELVKLGRVEDVVDATTGATKVELAPFVAKEAGLSTKRIIMIVQETQRFLAGAPMLKDKVRIDEIVNKKLPPLDEARALAAFLPSAESLEVKYRVYLRVGGNYVGALGEGAAPDTAIEAVLLNPGLPSEAANDTLGLCYKLASQNLRLPFVERCLNEVGAGESNPVLDAQRTRLRGTLAYLRGDKAGAVDELSRAAALVDAHQDPALHLRLLDAQNSAGQKDAACQKARALYGSHPLYPGVKDALAVCGNAAAAAKEVEAHERDALLAKKKTSGEPIPPLALETLKLEPTDVDVAKSNKITVLVFFATWCPHCQMEMPRLVAFQEALKKDQKLRDKVQLLGVRTAVERETESYDEFAKRYVPNFTVLTDPTMALAFSAFAKAAGISAGLPTVAVLDQTGRVRYILEGGDYKDTQRELLWAVQSLAR